MMSNHIGKSKLYADLVMSFHAERAKRAPLLMNPTDKLHDLPPVTTVPVPNTAGAVSFLQDFTMRSSQALPLRTNLSASK